MITRVRLTNEQVAFPGKLDDKEKEKDKETETKVRYFYLVLKILHFNCFCHHKSIFIVSKVN